MIEMLRPMRSVSHSIPFRLEQECTEGTHTIFADSGLNGVLVTSQASTLKGKKEKIQSVSPLKLKNKDNTPGSRGS